MNPSEPNEGRTKKFVASVVHVTR